MDSEYSTSRSKQKEIFPGCRFIQHTHQAPLEGYRISSYVKAQLEPASPFELSSIYFRSRIRLRIIRMCLHISRFHDPQKHQLLLIVDLTLYLFLPILRFLFCLHFLVLFFGLHDYTQGQIDDVRSSKKPERTFRLFEHLGLKTVFSILSFLKQKQ